MDGTTCTGACVANCATCTGNTATLCTTTVSAYGLAKETGTSTQKILACPTDCVACSKLTGLADAAALTAFTAFSADHCTTAVSGKGIAKETGTSTQKILACHDATCTKCEKLTGLADAAALTSFTAFTVDHCTVAVTGKGIAKETGTSTQKILDCSISNCAKCEKLTGLADAAALTAFTAFTVAHCATAATGYGFVTVGGAITKIL